MPAMQVTGTAGLCEQHSSNQHQDRLQSSVEQNVPRHLKALDVFIQPAKRQYDDYQAIDDFSLGCSDTMAPAVSVVTPETLGYGNSTLSEQRQS